MTITTSTFRLPDLLATFPWHRKLSEHYVQAKVESSAWTEHFHPFDDVGLKRFNLCDFNLLAGHAYSHREQEIVRLGCDLMNILYVCDEYTDVANADGVRVIHQLVLDVLCNPQKPRPAGEFLLGEMVRDFWLRVIAYVKPGAPCLEHFIQHFDRYLDAVVQEADDRTKHVFRDFESYLKIRRDSSACYVSFALCEFGLDIPEDVFQHPILVKLGEQANDFVCLDNDINSYPMEKSRGLETHNSVELIMREHDLTIQGAIDWLARYTAGIHDSFIENVAKMPSWGPDIDKRVKIYVDSLAQWIRGNDEWIFESGRYFGSKGLEVKKTRMMTLLPPSTGYVNKKSDSYIA